MKLASVLVLEEEGFAIEQWVMANFLWDLYQKEKQMVTLGEEYLVKLLLPYWFPIGSCDFSDSGYSSNLSMEVNEIL